MFTRNEMRHRGKNRNDEEMSCGAEELTPARRIRAFSSNPRRGLNHNATTQKSEHFLRGLLLREDNRMRFLQISWSHEQITLFERYNRLDLWAHAPTLHIYLFSHCPIKSIFLPLIRMSSDEVLCGEEKKPEESLDHLSCYDTV